ncbi:MAG: bifunctional adenosylcobinamide kinase/adenosylcobinamide-phosphate guanylyltransferase [Clostridiaceae bacterium]|nr:bifunctional adenosylcobinamide kinase/adenosylcobinamide-phosphate guanylyltransferase [Clostridiaceae bacterium]
MLILITGGSGSGKSALAEKLASRLASAKERVLRTEPVYVAAMIAGQDKESRERIARHQQQRSQLGFITREHPFDLEQLVEELNSPIMLLECLSNLLANEMFLRTDFGLEYLSPEQAAEMIDHALTRAEQCCEHLIVVSNEIFADAMIFDEPTKLYLRYLGWLNQRLAAKADLAVEMVYGLPQIQRGSAELLEGLL